MSDSWSGYEVEIQENKGNGTDCERMDRESCYEGEGQWEKGNIRTREGGIGDSCSGREDNE